MDNSLRLLVYKEKPIETKKVVEVVLVIVIVGKTTVNGTQGLVITGHRPLNTFLLLISPRTMT